VDDVDERLWVYIKFSSHAAALRLKELALQIGLQVQWNGNDDQCVLLAHATRVLPE
jgi:hypothetical protein